MWFLCKPNLNVNDRKARIRRHLLGCAAVFPFLHSTYTDAWCNSPWTCKQLFIPFIISTGDTHHPEKWLEQSTGMKVMNRHKLETSPAVTLAHFQWRKQGQERQQTPASQIKFQPATVQLLVKTELSRSCCRADENIAASPSSGAGRRKQFASLWGSFCPPKLWHLEKARGSSLPEVCLQQRW